jgi:DNA-binding Lrp family transcriptional regulator
MDRLDETDFRILNGLVRNGKVSFADLGKTVGLSPHGAGDRVGRLKRTGVITRFTAVIELANVGRATRLDTDAPRELFRERAITDGARVPTDCWRHAYPTGEPVALEDRAPGN